MKRSVRSTTGQALVRFIARQYIERDYKENRFIEGIWPIFGHGNAARPGQGIVEFGASEGLRFAESRSWLFLSIQRNGCQAWRDVPVAEVSSEETTRWTRSEYEEATRNQRPVFV